jgi:hemerythrin-like domain-containing protein
MKGKLTLSLFVDYMSLYFKDLKDSTRKLLDLINSFSKLTGYKINIQKSMGFLYTNNKHAEKDSEKIIPFTKKTLGMNLTKEVKYLCNENYTTLKKEIEEDTGRWKHILCLWIGRKFKL